MKKTWFDEMFPTPHRTAKEAAVATMPEGVQLGISISANAIGLRQSGSDRDIPADGWFPIAAYGSHPSPDGSYTQEFDHNQAEETVRTWNSIAGRAFRWLKNVRHRLDPKFTAPIVELAHVDTDPRDYSKLSTLGDLTDLRATANAIEGYVKWNRDAMAKRAAGPLYPSVLWWHDAPNAERKVFPVHIESVALVRDPNITSVPAWTQNASPEAAAKPNIETNMNKDKIIKALGLGADATEDQILSAIEDRTRTANAAVDRKKLVSILGLAAEATNEQIIDKITGATTTANAAPDRTKLITVLKLDANATNEQIAAAIENVRGERDGLTTANAQLVDGLLVAFELAGKVTPAQRDSTKAKFTANGAKIPEIVTELKDKKPEINTKSLELDGKRIDISTANSRRAAQDVAVSKRMDSDKCDYATAYDRVKADPAFKQLFEAMSDPTREAAKAAA